MEEPERHPYRNSADHFFISDRQFAAFKTDAIDLIRKELEKSSRGKMMERVHGFIAQPFPQTLQVWFGRRPIPERLTHDGKRPIESGATLLLSLGPHGHVLILLYPASSDLHSVNESHIRLDLVPMSTQTLKRRIPGYVRDLIAYQYVTTLDACATRSERLRVWWLRTTRTVETEGVQKIAAGKFIGWIANLFVRVGVGAIAKPLALMLILAIITAFGWSYGLTLFKELFVRQ